MMNERKLIGDQAPDGIRTEIQAADIGGEAREAAKDDDYLLFANSTRSYFQFQMKNDDSTN